MFTSRLVGFRFEVGVAELLPRMVTVNDIWLIQVVKIAKKSCPISEAAFICFKA
jgi:hypothetical protein